MALLQINIGKTHLKSLHPISETSATPPTICSHRKSSSLRGIRVYYNIWLNASMITFSEGFAFSFFLSVIQRMCQSIIYTKWRIFSTAAFEARVSTIYRSHLFIYAGVERRSKKRLLLIVELGFLNHLPTRQPQVDIFSELALFSLKCNCLFIHVANYWHSM